MIVTLEDAKAHLREVSTDNDSLIEMAIEDATAIVHDFLKIDAGTYDVDGSPGEAPPGHVRRAALLVIEALIDAPDGPAADPLTDAVRSLLHRSRDPALA